MKIRLCKIMVNKQRKDNLAFADIIPTQSGFSTTEFRINGVLESWDLMPRRYKTLSSLLKAAEKKGILIEVTC